MIWQPWGKYAKRCVEHGLSISKASVHGAWIYTLWKIRKIEREQDVMIGNYNSFDDAKAAAQKLLDESTI